MQKITPFLWFDGNLEETVNFYTTVFPTANVESMNPMSAAFVIEGQPFMALNGGPQFKFSEAVSFFIRCETQAEIDYFGEHLTAGGGVKSQCGWLKDKSGYPGKWYQMCSDNISVAEIAREHSESCKRCSR
jgi:predicted 3-demethylubiquinone-9 3-methyltransferase (glyoxalase superfamily)